MSRARVGALLGLVDSEDEDTSEILESVPQANNGARMPPAKRGRPAAANKTTKPVSATLRESATAASARRPLADKTTNVQPQGGRGRGKKRVAEEDIEVDDTPLQGHVAAQQEVKPKATRGRPRGTKAAKLADESTVSVEVEEEDKAAQNVTKPAKRGRKPKARVTTPPTEVELPETQLPDFPEADAPEIPETQPVNVTDMGIDMDLDQFIEEEQVEDLPSYDRPVASSAQRLRYYGVPMSASRAQPFIVPFSASRPQHHIVPFSANRRPMAASDSELNDPSLRRRIGDLTRKYEALEAKYRDLREIGVKEAERNFDKLKKQGEERINTANELIATLKAQLAAQTELAKEGQRVKQQLETSEEQGTELQSKLSSMTTSLSEARIEIKTLTTKLAASRTAETAANAKIPGSAMKGNTSNNRSGTNAEATLQVGQMKQDLYADLTGLIVRGVNRDQDEEVYDCIQTGRNGTLHFKLFLIPDERSTEFDEASFMYVPQLDDNRDRDLLELLPDYLVEEISFPRTHAAKFYARVMKCLTERLE